MNNYCSNCGNKINDHEFFCNKCGSSVNQQNIQVNMNNSQQNDHKSLKITSLVLGIVAIVGSLIFNVLIIPLAITGLVFGIIYSTKAKKFCAGIVLNILGIIIPIVIVCLLVFMTNSLVNNGTFFDDTTNSNYNEENDWYYEDEVVDESYLTEIQYFALMEKFENKDDFILLLSQTGCGHCTNYKPKLKTVANDYKIKVYYIEVDLLSNDEFDVLSSYVNFTGTPTTVFIKNGIEDPESSRITGDSSIDKIITIFERNGYI